MIQVDADALKKQFMVDIDVEVRDANPTLVKLFYGRLRELDRVEVEASGHSEMAAIWWSYRRSHYCKVGLVNGKVAAIWGVGGSLLGGTGLAWLLTTPEMEKVATSTIVQIGRSEVASMMALYPTLENNILQRYKKAIRLLMLLGFEIVGFPVKIGNEHFVKMRASLEG